MQLAKLKSKVKDGLQWSAISSVIIGIAELGRVAILARFLSPHDFGLLAMVIVFYNTGSVAIRGISHGLIPKQNVSDNEMSSMTWVSLGFGILVVMFIVAFSPFMAFIYPEAPETISILRILCIGILFTSVGNVYRVLLKKQLYIREISIVNICKTAFAVTVTILLAWLEFGVMALVYGNIVSACVEMSLSIYIGSRKLQWRPSLHFSWNDTKPFMRFGLYRSADFSLLSFIGNIDYLIIGRLLGTTSLGVYNVAYNISRKPSQKIIPILNSVVFPVFAKLNKDKETLKRGFMKGLKILSFILAPLSFGLASVASILIPLFLGREWSNTVPIVQLLSIYALFMGIENPIKQLTLAVGGADKIFRWNIANFLGITTAIILGAAITNNIYGIAFAILIYKVIFVLMSYSVLIRSYLQLNFYNFIMLFLPSLICSVLMAVSIIFALKNCLYILESEWLVLILSIFLGGGIYFLLSMIIQRTEIIYLISILPAWLRK